MGRGSRIQCDRGPGVCAPPRKVGGSAIRISSGGEHLEAHEVCEDMYIAIDRAVQKLERQISGAKGSAQSKQRRSGETVRTGIDQDTSDPTVES